MTKVNDIPSLHAHYPEIAAMLDEILAQLQGILGGKLVGVYLFGSLVMGDFDGISDLDLLVALVDDVDDAEFAALDLMHGAIVAAHPDWDDRIELLYLSVVGLQTFKTQRSPIAVISPGEPFHRSDAGGDWLLNWYIVREKGVTLLGVPPQSIIAPISRAEYVQSVREYATTKSVVDDATTRPGQAYLILTMCRALYTVTYGDHTSKHKAAAWAAERMPEWAATIQNALLWREQWKDRNVDPTTTLDNTRAFVDAVREKILEQPPL